MKDMHDKDRQGYVKKLNKEEVTKIRRMARHFSQREIARQFNITCGYVNKIIKRKARKNG
jgi:hypothetical protein